MVTAVDDNYNSSDNIIEFVNRPCREGNHLDCSSGWVGSRLNMRCRCICHSDKYKNKKLAYDAQLRHTLASNRNAQVGMWTGCGQNVDRMLNYISRRKVGRITKFGNGHQSRDHHLLLKPLSDDNVTINRRRQYRSTAAADTANAAAIINTKSSQSKRKKIVSDDIIINNIHRSNDIKRRLRISKCRLVRNLQESSNFSIIRRFEEQDMRRQMQDPRDVF